VFLGKALNGIASIPLSGGYTGSNRWQLDSKTEKVISLSPGRGNLVNKRANCKLHPTHLYHQTTSFCIRSGYIMILQANSKMYSVQKNIAITYVLL